MQQFSVTKLQASSFKSGANGYNHIPPPNDKNLNLELYPILKCSFEKVINHGFCYYRLKKYRATVCYFLLTAELCKAKAAKTVLLSKNYGRINYKIEKNVSTFSKQIRWLSFYTL